MLATYSSTPKNVAHVTPPDDVIEHKLVGFGCVCGPEVQYERFWDGCEDGWIVMHKSLARSD